jgi:hypothetical protein
MWVSIMSVVVDSRDPIERHHERIMGFAHSYSHGYPPITALIVPTRPFIRGYIRHAANDSPSGHWTNVLRQAL